MAINKNGIDSLESKVFRRLGRKTDEFEVFLHPHAERIAILADELAKLFGLASKDRQSLRAAALLHDLGEATMQRDYIRHTHSLTDEERLDLQRHPIIGEQEAAKSGGDRATQLIVRWHHEWWNGGGYPDALRREEIPLAARLLRVADSYAAITDARPFRAAMDQTTARQHMADWAGIEFDPRIVRALLSLGPLPELESFAVAHNEPDATPAVPLEVGRDLFSSFIK
jgi:HD-GYP domain-containing protein (c-di-GMP phosphodiesterase class II)